MGKKMSPIYDSSYGMVKRVKKFVRSTLFMYFCSLNEGEVINSWLM